MGFSGRAENYNSGHESYSKTIGKPREQRSSWFFYRREKEVRRAVINKKSLEVNQEWEM